MAFLGPNLNDPVGFSFVASLARPGGQVTGIVTTLDSLPGKQLQLVLEVVPGAARAAFPGELTFTKQPGQLSAAIQAEVKRGELRRFYVKQVETGETGDFSRMSTEELRAYVYGEQLPLKGAKGPVKH